MRKKIAITIAGLIAIFAASIAQAQPAITLPASLPQEVRDLAVQGHTGREYLHGFATKIHNNAAVKITIAGDSTVAGAFFNGISTSIGIGAAYKPEYLLSRYAWERGLRSVTTVNAGNGGAGTDDWTSTHLATDMAGDPDLYIWHYGVNDPSLGASGFDTQLRNGLTAMRAHANGGYAAMDCVLMTPNTIHDPGTGRDEDWVRTIRPLIKQAAEDFRCAYFDTFGLYEDGQNGIDKWIDDISASNDGSIGVHPSEDLNALIYAQLGDFIYPMAIDNRINSYFNIPSATQTVDFSVAPSNFRYGMTSYATGSGWPSSGYFLSSRHIDGSVVHIFVPADGGVPQMRSSNVAGNTWGTLTPIGGTAETSSTSISAGTNTTLGTSADAPIVVKVGTRIQTGGQLFDDGSPTTLAQGETLATIPSGYWPTSAVYTSMHIRDFSDNEEIVAVTVQTNGVVLLNEATTITPRRLSFVFSYLGG